MKLVPASLVPPPGLLDLLMDIGPGENGFAGSPVAAGTQTLEEHLEICCEMTDPAAVPPHLVPQTTYWVIDDDGTAAGMVRVRHRLNDKLLVRGGHIGYYIRKDRRGRGLAREALRLALLELRNLGESRALITIHPGNRPSIRVAEANGGRFADERIDPETGIRHCRYWIDLQPPGQVLAGAIRWDAWSGGEITAQVERSLGPARYHPRLPWFAEVLDENRVRILGSRPDVMAREIAYAADAGLDHWAFLLYPEEQSMSQGLKDYLKSPDRRRLRFCLILHNAFSVPEDQWPRERDRAVTLLREPGYRTVLGGRPLVYLFSVKNAGTRLPDFRTAAKAAGLDPYCVYMGWNPARDYAAESPHGFEAVSAYAYAKTQGSFSELAAGVEKDFWANAAAAGVPYVPLVTTGWDKQPRKDNPVSWELDHAYHKQARFPAPPTPPELAGHLARGLTFVREHPAVCPARCVILYAWNEHDEGGWLSPTWTPRGPNTERMDAIRSILAP